MKAAIDFISKDVLQYMEQNNLEFNDSQAVALICHSWLSVPERHKRLEEFAAETEDENLRKQITEMLSVEKEDLKAFHKNTKGFVYAVLAKETSDEPCGYFATPELAYAHGLKQTCAFTINKYQIVGQNGAEMRKSKGYWNPYLMTEMSMEELVDESDRNGLIAWLDYTQDGILQDFWSQEIERSDKGNIERLYSPNRFENAFVPMPNPFERGDIVRRLPNGCHGVVSTSAEEWLDLLEKVNAGKYKGSDFSDASVTVEFVHEDYICHDHVNPAFLERYEPEKGDDDYDLLMTASDLLRGRGGLGWFVRCYETYKEKHISEVAGEKK